MIGDHVYVFFTFFGPDLEVKEEDKRRSIFARASAILFTVDITHMRLHVGRALHCVASITCAIPMATISSK